MVDDGLIGVHFPLNPSAPSSFYGFHCADGWRVECAIWARGSPHFPAKETFSLPASLSYLAHTCLALSLREVLELWSLELGKVDVGGYLRSISHHQAHSKWT